MVNNQPPGSCRPIYSVSTPHGYCSGSPPAFSFKNAIIILTSNLGSSAILDNMGTDMGQQDIKDMVMGYVSERGPHTRALLGWERIGACRHGASCCFSQLGQLSSCCIPLEVKFIP